MERFTKVRNIGKGNMGACTLARNNEDGRHYVIKQVDLGKLNKKERQQSLNEAKLLSSLRHPNVINYVDSFLARKSDHLCIVMEFADGGDLSNKVKNAHGVNFPQDQILDWAIQIALALQHITSKRILHRDVKTQNVFLTSDGLVKLGDFGIARTLNSTFDQAHTFVGTPYYLSPELILERPYDAASDTWAFGVCLYEMMALKHPFNAGDMKSLMQRILKVQYDAPPTCYSPELRTIITRLLTKDPAQRLKLSEMLEMPIMVTRMKQWLQGGILPSRYISSLVRHKLLPPSVMAAVGSLNPALDNSLLPTVPGARRTERDASPDTRRDRGDRRTANSNVAPPSEPVPQNQAPRGYPLGGANPLGAAPVQPADVRTEFRDVRLKPKPPLGAAPMPTRDPSLLDHRSGVMPIPVPPNQPQMPVQQRPGRGALPSLPGQGMPSNMAPQQQQQQQRRGSDAAPMIPPRLAAIPARAAVPSNVEPAGMPRGSRLPSVQPQMLPQAGGQAPQHRW
jgi:NIMA (never in mitosis gene a)-related kinase